MGGVLGRKDIGFFGEMYYSLKSLVCRHHFYLRGVRFTPLKKELSILAGYKFKTGYELAAMCEEKDIKIVTPILVTNSGFATHLAQGCAYSYEKIARKSLIQFL